MVNDRIRERYGIDIPVDDRLQVVEAQEPKGYPATETELSAIVLEARKNAEEYGANLVRAGVARSLLRVADPSLSKRIAMSIPGPMLRFFAKIGGSVNYGEVPTVEDFRYQEKRPPHSIIEVKKLNP